MSRFPQRLRHAAYVAQSLETDSFAPANDPDQYPVSDEPPEASPFAPLDWQYVSVFLVTAERDVLLILSTGAITGRHTV